jgi:hypothetical protein
MAHGRQRLCTSRPRTRCSRMKMRTRCMRRDRARSQTTLYPGRRTARARAFHSRPGTAVKNRSLSGCALAAERAALGKRASSAACTPAAPPAPRASARYSPIQARRGGGLVWQPAARQVRRAVGAPACRPARWAGAARASRAFTRWPPGHKQACCFFAHGAWVRVSGGRAPRSTRRGGRERLKTFSPVGDASAGPAPAPPGSSSSGPRAAGGSCDAGAGALVSAPAAAAAALAAAAAAARARRSARAAAASSSAAARPASGHCAPAPCAERSPPATGPQSPGPARAPQPAAMSAAPRRRSRGPSMRLPPPQWPGPASNCMHAACNIPAQLPVRACRLAGLQLRRAGLLADLATATAMRQHSEYLGSSLS